MRTEGFKGALLSVLMVAALAVPAVSLSQIGLVRTGATLAKPKEKNWPRGL